jgi:hypothetical protein
MKVINQVIQTDNYDLFKTLAGNRHIFKLHVNRLKESFKTAYLLSPIIVNQNYEIIDGQHRYEAAKLLNLPINFIICNDYGLKEVQILNTNMKNWKKEDYLNAYCDLKYPEYLVFRNFMRKYKDFGIKVCEIILTNRSSQTQGTDTNREFSESKSGRYTIKYFEEGDLLIQDINKSIKEAEKIMMIKPYYDGFNRPAFVAAMHAIFKIPEYSHSKFIERLKSNPTRMQHCSNITQYKLLIEDIYNFRTREKVSLRY